MASVTVWNCRAGIRGRSVDGQFTKTNIKKMLTGENETGMILNVLSSTNAWTGGSVGIGRRARLRILCQQWRVGSAGTSDEVSAFFVLFGVSRNIEKRSEPGAAESISFLYIFMFVQRRQYVKYIQEAGPRITARLFLPPAGGGFSPVKTKGFYL